MSKIECPCGAIIHTTKISDNALVKKETQWFSYMSTEFCLTTVWICPACHTKVVEAAKSIRAIFGEKARHIYYNNLFREPKEPR